MSPALLAILLIAAQPMPAPMDPSVEVLLGDHGLELDEEPLPEWYTGAWGRLNSGQRDFIYAVARGEYDAGPTVRRRAVACLRHEKGDRQEKWLVDILGGKPDKELRTTAHHALSAICDVRARRYYDKQLRHRAHLDRLALLEVLNALGRCGDLDFFPLLDECIAGPDALVSNRARRAKERIQDGAPTTSLLTYEDAAPVEVVWTAQTSPDPAVQGEIYNPPRAVLPEGWDKPIAAPAPAVTAPPPPAVTPAVSAPTGSPTAFPALLADMTALQSDLARATSSALGAEFIAVFNDHATELTVIFNNDPSLGARISNLVDQFGGLASRLVEGTLSEADFFLAKELQHQMDDLLRDLYTVASRPLAGDLHKARNAEKQALFDALRAAGMSDDGNFGKPGAK